MKGIINKIFRIILLTFIGLGLILFLLGILARIMGWMDFRPTDQQIMKSIQASDQLAFMDTLDWEGGSTAYAAVKAINNDSVAVFYVHGSPGSLDANLSYLNHPELRGRFAQYSYDRIGYGGSRPSSAAVTLKEQSDQLAALVRQVGAKHNYFTGHSLGCTIAAFLAMDRPELVDGLVLVGAALDPDLEPSSWWRPVLDFPVISLGIPSSFRVSNDELAPLKDELKKCSDKWKNIQCPVTFVQGNIDKLVPAENVDFGMRVMTNADTLRMIMLEDKGHFIYWTETDLIVREIERLISKSINN